MRDVRHTLKIKRTNLIMPTWHILDKHTSKVFHIFSCLQLCNDFTIWGAHIAIHNFCIVGLH